MDTRFSKTDAIRQRTDSLLEQFSTLYAHSSDHCFFVDRSFNILFYNKDSSLVDGSFMNLLNLSEQANVKQNISEIFTQSSSRKFSCIISRNDNRMQLAFSANFVLGSKPFCLMVGQEIGDEEKQIENLKAGNEFLKEFVYGATHDLRSPLLVLKGFVSLIRRFKDERKKEEALQNIENATIALEHTLLGMTGLIDLDKHSNKPIKDISFEKMFENTQFRLMNEIEKSKPAFKTNFEIESIPYIDAHLASIFQNLVSNAIKYHKKNMAPVIEISTKREGEFVVLSVKDNGIGMDLEKFGDKLFTPFKRLTGEVDGLGLGLSIINNRLRNYGGRFEVESRLGEGSTFNVYLIPMIQNS